MIESKKYIKYELKVLALLYKKGWFFFFFFRNQPENRRGFVYELDIYLSWVCWCRALELRSLLTISLWLLFQSSLFLLNSSEAAQVIGIIIPLQVEQPQERLDGRYSNSFRFSYRHPTVMEAAALYWLLVCYVLNYLISKDYIGLWLI